MHKLFTSCFFTLSADRDRDQYFDSFSGSLFIFGACASVHGGSDGYGATCSVVGYRASREYNICSLGGWLSSFVLEPVGNDHRRFQNNKWFILNCVMKSAV